MKKRTGAIIAPWGHNGDSDLTCRTRLLRSSGSGRSRPALSTSGRSGPGVLPS